MYTCQHKNFDDKFADGHNKEKKRPHQMYRNDTKLRFGDMVRWIHGWYNTPPHACLVTARVVGRLMPYRDLTHGVESHHDHVFTAIISSRPYVYRHVRCNDTSPAVEPKQYKIMITKLGVCINRPKTQAARTCALVHVLRRAPCF